MSQVLYARSFALAQKKKWVLAGMGEIERKKVASHTVTKHGRD
jgi:hypothetical protein